MFGNWEYQYKKKEPDEDGHYWIAFGHTIEKFNEALQQIGAYEEYYSQFFAKTKEKEIGEQYNLFDYLEEG